MFHEHSQFRGIIKICYYVTSAVTSFRIFFQSRLRRVKYRKSTTSVGTGIDSLDSLRDEVLIPVQFASVFQPSGPGVNTGYWVGAGWVTLITTKIFFNWLKYHQSIHFININEFL